MRMVVAAVIFAAAALNTTFAQTAHVVAEDWEKTAGSPLPLDSASVELEAKFPGPGQPKCYGTGPLGPLSNDGYGLDGFAFGYRGCSVSDYIEFAYKLSLVPSQEQSLLVQLPSWAVTDRFEIRLKGPGNATKDQKRLTMQSLLAERFNLAVHFETQVVPVFALVLSTPGETGPQLQAHPEGASCSTPVPWPKFARYFPRTCGAIIGGVREAPDGRADMGGRDVTIAQIANALTQQDSGVERPIVDQTGLTGKYDFAVVFTPTEEPQYGSAYIQRVGGPAFEEALRDQLGLKLEPTTGPVDVLVIDHLQPPVAGFAPSPQAQPAAPSPAAEYHDAENGVSLKLPSGWHFSPVERWGDRQNTVHLIEQDSPSVRPALYYKILKSAQKTTSDDGDQREISDKVSQRKREGFQNYRVRDGSREQRLVNGNSAVSWVADYTENDKDMSEYLVRVRTAHANALFFALMPSTELDSFRQRFDPIIETLETP